MRELVHGESTKVGIAYSNYVPAWLEAYPEAVDYVEVPYELLRYDPTVMRLGDKTPLLLHCGVFRWQGLCCPAKSWSRTSAAWQN